MIELAVSEATESIAAYTQCMPDDQRKIALSLIALGCHVQIGQIDHRHQMRNQMIIPFPVGQKEVSAHA